MVSHARDHSRPCPSCVLCLKTCMRAPVPALASASRAWCLTRISTLQLRLPAAVALAVSVAASPPVLPS